MGFNFNLIIFYIHYVLIFYFTFLYSFCFFNSPFIFIFILVPFIDFYFILFFAIFFFFCASNEFIMCFICMSLFLVYPNQPLKFSEKNAKTLRTIGKKTQVPFVSAVVLLYVFNWTIYFISLRPPILRAFQPPPQPRSQAPLLLVPKRTLGKRLP